MDIDTHSQRRRTRFMILIAALLVLLDVVRLLVLPQAYQEAFMDGFETVVGVLCVAACWFAAWRSLRVTRGLWIMCALFFALLASADFHDLLHDLAASTGLLSSVAEFLGWSQYLPLALLVFFPLEKDGRRDWTWPSLLDFLLVTVAAAMAYFRLIYLPHSLAGEAWLAPGHAELARNILLSSGLLVRAAFDPSSQSRYFYRRIGGVFGGVTILHAVFPGYLDPVSAVGRPALWLVLGVLAVSSESLPPEATAQGVRRNALRLALSLFSAATLLLVVVLAVSTPAPRRNLMNIGLGLSVVLFFSRRYVAERSRYAAESKLRASERDYRILFETAALPIVIFEPEAGRILHANTEACELYGVAREEFVGASLKGFTKDVAECEKVIAEALRAGVCHRAESVHLTRDRREIHVSVSASVVQYRGQTAILSFNRDVTEGKRAEEALRLVSAYNRSLIESSLDPLVTISPEGKITDVNRATEIVTGFNRQELIGTDFSDYFDDPESARAGYCRVFQEGRVQDYELAIRHRDGDTTPVLYNASVYRGPKGEVAGVFAAARDVTEQKRAAEALRRASTYNRSLIEASLDPLVTIDPEGRITDVNHATEKVTGRSKAELLGTDFAEYFTEPEAARQGYRQVYREGVVQDYELAIRHRDGHVTPVMYNASLYRDETGNVGGVFAAARDISERKRGEAALRESETRFRSLVEDAPLGIRISQDGLTVYVNRKYLSMFGYKRADELVGQTLEPQWAPESRQDINERIRRRKLGLPLAPAMEGIAQRRDGSQFPVHCEITTVNLPDGPASLTFFTDITERKRAEAELADRLRFETLLAELSGRFVHVPAERLDAEIEAALRRVCESLGLGMCTLWQLSTKAPGFITLTHQYGPPGGLPATEHLNGWECFPWCSQQVLAGNVVAVSSLEELPAEAARDREAWRQFGVKSNLTIGLAVGGGPIVGALSFNTMQAECTWPEPLLKRLQLLAQLFSNALARQQSDKELRESEERFRGLVENATVGIYRTTPDGRIVMANPALVKMMGYDSFEELASRNLEEEGFAPGYRRSEFKDRLERESQISGLEGAWLRRGGTMIFVRESARAIRDGQGCVIFYDGVIEDITEGKKAEESRRYLASIVESSDDAIFGKNLEGMIQSWNRGAENLYGHTAAEMIGQSVSQLAPPDRLDEIKDILAHIRRGEQIEHYETVRTRKDGTRIDVSVTISPIKDAGGQVVGASSVARDITERKQAQEQIRVSEERFRKAFMTGADAYYIATLYGALIHEANDRFEDVFGYAREEVIGKTSIELGLYVDPSERKKFVAEIERNNYARNMELKCRRKDGRIIDVLLSGNLLKGYGEAMILGVVRDISEQKRAQESLVKLRQAVDASGEVIFMTDRQGIITFVNPEFTRLYGYSETEVVGKATPRILKSGSQPPEKIAEFWRTLFARQVARGPIVNETKDGHLLTMHSSASPILDEADNIIGFLAIQRDITEHQRLEQQFIQAQKMEAVGRLAAGVAHDFNNLLTIINGHSALMLKQLPSDNPARESFADIKDAGERAAALTRQLLAFSRQQVCTSTILDLNAIVSDSIKMLRRLIGEDIELVFDPAPDVGKVSADAGQIEQVLMNLAVNSRDAMPRGGKLTLEVSNFQANKDYAARHYPMPPGSYVMLVVSDTGCGIDWATQARIFEPFFTTKEQGKGTGLGLATVYGIVKQNGGYIWVHSELGFGTTFKIYLPLVEGTAEAKEARGVSAGGSETVLLVEDELNVRSLARRMLESEGYKVLEAPGGMEALLMVSQHKGSIHLLLTDVVMPAMSGRELAEQLAKRHPEMRILYMSGYTDDTVVRHGVLESGVAFLQKPFAPEVLARKVREVLDAENVRQ